MPKILITGCSSGFGLALQLPFMEISESMGNHDSKIVGADSVD
jgi:short-subunit dehydrogenase involved in D-alanine esterification of teichoic acids